jgi:hypothetical protein
VGQRIGLVGGIVFKRVKSAVYEDNAV